MALSAVKSVLKEILPLREIFLQENNFQIRYNACHERNWSDSYLLCADGMTIGYGSVKGKNELKDRDDIFELFLLPSFRRMSASILSELIASSGAKFIECQSNDHELSSLLFEFAENISSDTILFKEHTTTNMLMPGFLFREHRQDDIMFEHHSEPEGDWVLERNGEIVTSGGFMLHYNRPFADLYMEVKPDWRQRGLGSFFIQELKKACYLEGRVPAARCGIHNQASRYTLLKAGMQIAGYMLSGNIRGTANNK